MEGTAQNQEQVHSPEQQEAEHLPKAPTELFLFFFLFNTSLTSFPAKKHLAAVLNFNQISAASLTAMKNGLQAQG